jgi:hypothetical protein
MSPQRRRVPVTADEMATDHLIDFCICQLSPAWSKELWRIPDERCDVHQDQDAMALRQVAA